MFLFLLQENTDLHCWCVRWNLWWCKNWWNHSERRRKIQTNKPTGKIPLTLMRKRGDWVCYIWVRLGFCAVKVKTPETLWVFCFCRELFVILGYRVKLCIFCKLCYLIKIHVYHKHAKVEKGKKMAARVLLSPFHVNQFCYFGIITFVFPSWQLQC